MFSTKENECVGFESIWKVKRVYTVSEAQTSELSTQEHSTNTSISKSMETQTDENPVINTDYIDNSKLSDWLQRIYPMVSKELNESLNSQAFKNFKFSNSSEQPVLKLLQTLKPQDTIEDKVSRVSSLSWNSTGNTLALSCNEVHKTWCYHTGTVLLYTFNRYDKLTETPIKRLRTEACVNIVCFHPALPSVIAAGTQSGHVIIWNTQYDDSDMICKINAHEELITHMSWIHDIDVAKSFLLATSSLDGYLSLWNFNTIEKTLKPKHMYQVKSPLLSKTTRKTPEPDEISKKIIRGIITFDFSPYKHDIFLIGAEGGLVIQCSLLGTVSLRGSSSNVPISDPTYKYFQPHEGEVTKVSFSPNRREMFLTSGTDGEIRIYTLEQDEPCKIIFLETPLSSVSWVPFQEKIIAGCGHRGIMEVYKLLTAEEIEITVKDYVETATLTQIALNRVRTCTVAMGTDKGSLQIWNVPWNLYNCYC